MAQHDYVISNGTGSAVRSDLNNALSAIVSQNSGATAPATTYAFQFWADTTTNTLKLRNSANSAWIELRQLDGDFTTVSVDNGTAAAPSIYFNASGTDTGIYSSGTDAVDISTAGTRRFGISSSGELTAYGGNLTLNGQGDLRFADSDSSNWVAFQSPATVSSNVTWTLPSADGTNGQALTTNGSGTLSWTSPAATTDKITEGNTEAEVVDTGSDGHFKVTTEGTERLRCDSSGRLLVGTSSSSLATKIHVQGSTSPTNATAYDGTVVVTDGATDHVAFYGHNSSATGTTNGTVSLTLAPGGNGQYRSQIVAGRDGNFSTSTENKTNLRFLTAGGGGESSVERMRITSNGYMRLGDGTTYYHTIRGGGGNEALEFTANAGQQAATTVSTIKFLNSDTGGAITERMRIDNSGYVTIYKNTSNLARLNFDASSTRLEYSDATGHLSFYTNSSARVRINYGGGFVPVTDNSQSLGSSSERWTAVYAVNGTIQTSDLREKTNVETSSLGTEFIKQLRPVSYKFKIGENIVTKGEDGETDIVTPRAGERTHWGFIAQEVKEVVDAAGIDFGGWVLTDKDDPDSTQGLRYDQFIAPLTAALQEAIGRIETLEAEVAALKAQ